MLLVENMEVFTVTDAHQNLKGEAYPLIYYRTVHEDAKIEKSRWTIDKDGKFKEFFYHDTIVNRIIFKEDKVKEFSLDGLGQNLEFEDHQFTMIHNYLIHFWQPILKADAFALYITLKSYCINKDYCWPSITTLEKECGLSKNTVKDRLARLEHYGFVFRFNCMSAAESNDRKKNLHEAPIFKVRKRVPFLPKEIYEELSEELQIKHDMFMKKYMSVYSSDNLANRIDFESIYNEFLEEGEIKKKQVKQKKSVSIERVFNLKESMTTRDEEITNHILNYIQKKISKPSFETWFQHCLIKLRENVLTVYAASSFTAGWINDRHKVLIENALKEIDIEPIDIKITCIEE